MHLSDSLLDMASSSVNKTDNEKQSSDQIQESTKISEPVNKIKELSSASLADEDCEYDTILLPAHRGTRTSAFFIETICLLIASTKIPVCYLLHITILPFLLIIS